jgi:hypothetical protein
VQTFCLGESQPWTLKEEDFRMRSVLFLKRFTCTSIASTTPRTPATRPATLEVRFTDLYATSTLPIKNGGCWYVSYSRQYAWRHFEAK